MLNFEEIGTILVIDDNPTNLQVLYKALSDRGYDVLVEMDGQSGIELVKNSPPDLILLDVMMPGIDGFETCSRLQADPITKEIPIIFMTALSDTVDKVKGLSLGAVDYISKPFQQEEVLARIKVHLKLRRLSLQLIEQNQQLEERVEKRTAKLYQTIKELKQTQLQLVQSEKMSAIGQLIAGIAHEINNPVGCIVGNIEEATNAIKDLTEYLHLCQEKCHIPGSEIESKALEIDLEFLIEDLPKMLFSMKTGIDRIRNISNSLRTFSRADSEYKVLADIREGIDSTLMILQHRLKANNNRPAIQVIKNYGDIPLIKCYLGQLNQVFMNVVANAIDALEEANQGRTFASFAAAPNTITITTKLSDSKEDVLIKIKDNGKGMSEEIISHIFDHSFTTKAVGKGTGIGLSISRQIVEETQGGCLTCASILGEGTEFTIALHLE
ncbi:response regulator [Microcoleus sp. herbarium14]|uniref:hybrid sensor histidine kinase/response regulator n=1 Tax=Microcoleus sp. herbarium14 TaxID=3055439 RepID=UPI002FD04C17